ncbi:unnamed protein product [Alopecurus aequalis]
MSPYGLLVFAFYAWLFPSAASTARSSASSSPAPPRLVGTVFGLALHVSALSLAHAALVPRLLDAFCGCRWAAFLLFALVEAACLCALFILSIATAASFAISVASFYCCAAENGARDVLVERLIQEYRCRRLVVNFVGALDLGLLCSAATWAILLALRWLFARALPGAPALDLSDARDWYVAEMLYLGAEWQLAAVVSVLEPDEHARRCFSRSSALLAGNFCAAAGVFTFLVHCFELVHAVFGSLVLRDRMGLGFELRVATALAVLAALCAVVVVALVAHPVVYFACKAYHGEAIDLGLGEHEPLDASNNTVH